MGAAGDMLAAALLELLPDTDKFVGELNAIGIPGTVFKSESSVKCGITGTHITVTVNGEEEESHDYSHELGQPQDHDHSHESGHHSDHDHSHEVGQYHDITTTTATNRDITTITIITVGCMILNILYEGILACRREYRIM